MASKRERVIVAMSGGVDSSVAAALLVEQGYEVTGIGLRLLDAETGEGTDRPCCGLADMSDARRVAAKLGIPFYVLNRKTAFDQAVVEPFCQAYAAGRTPNPCVACNARLKFGSLLDLSLALGVDFLVTGHYARVESGLSTLRPILRKARDKRQDQSYFLYALSPRALEHALFPLGHLGKRQVRQIATDWGLHVSKKPSSQDICFVRGADYREFLIQRCPKAFRPGPIVNLSGCVVGNHRGIANYTLGQRKGLGIAANQRLYVVALDATTNTVIVGPEEETYVRTLAVGDLNWISCDPPAAPLRLSVRTRYRGPETPAEVSPGGGCVLVNFSQPHPIAAPGQAAVFYSGDRLMGGGVIR